MHKASRNCKAIAPHTHPERMQHALRLTVNHRCPDSAPAYVHAACPHIDSVCVGSACECAALLIVQGSDVQHTAPNNTRPMQGAALAAARALDDRLHSAPGGGFAPSRVITG
eukprot:14901349-Alexandrium_andersonii.AAC.1